MLSQMWHLPLLLAVTSFNVQIQGSDCKLGQRKKGFDSNSHISSTQTMWAVIRTSRRSFTRGNMHMFSKA